MMGELTGMGYSPEEAQMMLMTTQNPQPGGGQSTPGGILRNEPNKSGVNSGAGGGMMAGGLGVNPEAMMGSFVQSLQGLPDAQREQLLMKLQVQNPQMHGQVTQKLMEAQGIDARPNPQQKPPNRNAGKTPSPSKV